MGGLEERWIGEIFQSGSSQEKDKAATTNGVVAQICHTSASKLLCMQAIMPLIHRSTYRLIRSGEYNPLLFINADKCAPLAGFSFIVQAATLESFASTLAALLRNPFENFRTLA